MRPARRATGGAGGFAVGLGSDRPPVECLGWHLATLAGRGAERERAAGREDIGCRTESRALRCDDQTSPFAAAPLGRLTDRLAPPDLDHPVDERANSPEAPFVAEHRSDILRHRASSLGPLVDRRVVPPEHVHERGHDLVQRRVEQRRKGEVEVELSQPDPPH